MESVFVKKLDIEFSEKKGMKLELQIVRSWRRVYINRQRFHQIAENN